MVENKASFIYNIKKKRETEKIYLGGVLNAI